MRSSTAFLPWILILAQAGAQEPLPGSPLKSVLVEGGDGDDRLFARAALGLRVGQPVDETAFQQALAAVRLVDRFRAVTGTLEATGVARVRLQPLPLLEAWLWEGDPVPPALRKSLLPEQRKGQRMGQQRLEALIKGAEHRLREAGYPHGRIQSALEKEGRVLRLTLSLGDPALIREIRIEGTPGPYSREVLLKAAGLQPGKSLWTPLVLREAQRSLRQYFVGKGRLEGAARLVPAPGAEGVLIMEVQAGPVVILKANGLSLFGPLWGRPRLSEFVPLARAERYSPSLLDEGDGRIAAHFREQGYPDARSSHLRVVTGGTAEQPEQVTLTYTVEPGVKRTLGKVQFEGNRELSEADLRAVTVLPKRFLMLSPFAKAETVKGLEDRITATYLQRGFPDVRVKRRVETAKDGSVEVRFIIREGRQRFVNELLLEIPPDAAYPRERLTQSLLMVFSDRPVPVQGMARYHSDRRHLQGHEGTLESTPQGARLTFQPPLPLVRNDLALVVSDLRQRLASAGAANPQVKLALEGEEGQSVIRIQLPTQPFDQVRRLVVQGSDRTRAEALLREVVLAPGAALDLVKLDEGQIQLGSLGAFQRVDVLTLKDLAGQEQFPWQRGDLTLRLEERPPWVFTEAFGYDKTQGYHFGLNAQRLNVGGMGRTLDFGLRAGDQSLDSPALRRAFPTGDVKRSVDSYSLGYTDPWFLPNALDSWLTTRTRFHMEGAYIQEAQAAFSAHRRRFTPSLEWKLGPVQAVQLGYRFERVEVAANTDNQGVPLLLDQDLFLLARTPARSIISAPYLQVAVDRRDRPYDPTQGTYFLGRLELANQAFGTSPNSSFVKLDLRQQWNWPVGFHAEHGVVTAGVRLGLARPTAKSAEDLPLTERFFGGGSFTVRGVEPDMLGEVRRTDSSGKPLPQVLPLGGQGLALINLEYRFPLFGIQSVWAEVFVDSGQVYRSLRHETGAVAPFPPLRTTLGAGLILKLGFPLKLEYAADWKRIMGRPRTQDERDTQLKSLLISAGFQF